MNLEGILERLIRSEVEFVIVGGYAAVAYGVSSVTQDVDICCRFIPSNLLKLQNALADLHPVHRMTPKRIPLRLTSDSCQNLKNVYLDTDLGQLDCLGYVNGIGDYDQVYDASITIDLSNGSCRILSIDALIKAKRAMGRPRDHQVVLELETIKTRLNTQ